MFLIIVIVSRAHTERMNCTDVERNEIVELLKYLISVQFSSSSLSFHFISGHFI